MEAMAALGAQREELKSECEVLGTMVRAPMCIKIRAAAISELINGKKNTVEEPHLALGGLSIGRIF